MSTFVVLMRVVYVSYDEKVSCKKHNLDNETHSFVQVLILQLNVN